MVVMDTIPIKAFQNYKEWVRCNLCLFKIDEKELNFFITQCGHVYCNRCIDQAKKKCFHCGETDVLSLPVKEPLNSQIAHYFTSPESLREKAEQAEIFQKSQIKIFLERVNEVQDKYKTLKQDYVCMVKDMKALHHKYIKLKNIALTMQQDNKKMLFKNGSYTPIKCHATPDKKIHNSSYKSNEGFKVPITTRVPKSAGYYSASTSASDYSNYQDLTPTSSYSNQHYGH